MSTARQLRDKIIEIAKRAQELHPTSVDARAVCFIARLSGAMQILGEFELDNALWDLVTTEQPSSKPTDGA
jgi:hypothetical protein